jgi:hypothetical protein
MTRRVSGGREAKEGLLTTIWSALDWGTSGMSGPNRPGPGTGNHPGPGTGNHPGPGTGNRPGRDTGEHRAHTAAAGRGIIEWSYAT